jgi:hypothetical protein
MPFPKNGKYSLKLGLLKTIVFNVDEVYVDAVVSLIVADWVV